MDRRPPQSAEELIEHTSPRALFAELVAVALGETRVQATPMAVAYLIELLDGRVRCPEAPPDSEGSLAEDLLQARRLDGPGRIRQLRDLGDRALFVSGFFGDSLRPRVVDLGYYGEAGRLAYGELSAEVAHQLRERTWSELFEELADRFRDFADVLAEVSDRTTASKPAGLLRIYERFLETGSPRERRRLACLGHFPAQLAGLRRWQ